MTMNGRSLADPATLARIARLDLRARAVVEGVISGMHRSPHRGSSVEFAQHRDYVPGDEIRHIDWKVYARSDRYHIKQFEEETNLKATLVLDASRSMDYRGERSQLSKREYSATIAAALSSLLMRQRDSVGLALFDSEVRQYIPPSSTPAHLRLLYDTLERQESQPKTGMGATFHDLAERVRRRGLLIVLSDLLADPQEILRGLRHFRHRKHEVIVLQILDRDELTFPFKEAAIFEGMEEEPALMAEPNALRKHYLQALEAHQESIVRGCRELDSDYQMFVTDTPLDDSLARYLARRMQRN